MFVVLVLRVFPLRRFWKKALKSWISLNRVGLVRSVHFPSAWRLDGNGGKTLAARAKSCTFGEHLELRKAVKLRKFNITLALQH